MLDAIGGLDKKNYGKLQGRTRNYPALLLRENERIRKRRRIDPVFRKRVNQSTKRYRHSLGSAQRYTPWTWFEHCMAFLPGYSVRRRALALRRTVISVLRHTQYTRARGFAPTAEEIGYGVSTECPYSGYLYLRVFRHLREGKPLHPKSGKLRVTLRSDGGEISPFYLAAKYEHAKRVGRTSLYIVKYPTKGKRKYATAQETYDNRV